MNQLLQNAIIEHADDVARTRQSTRSISETYITSRLGADALSYVAYVEDQDAWNINDTNLYLKYSQGESGLFLTIIENRFIIGSCMIKIRNLKTLGEALASLQETHGNRIKIL